MNRGVGTNDPLHDAATPMERIMSQLPDKKARQKLLEDVLLDLIGTPDDLWKVDVKQLWNMDNYRINIYREIDGPPALTDSFFATCTDDGPEFHPEPTFRYYDLELAKLFDGEPNCLVPYALVAA